MCGNGIRCVAKYVYDFGLTDKTSISVETLAGIKYLDLTVENGKWHLSYINPENEQKGYCNMWKRQGFSYERVDAHGTRFHFLDGDFLLFDLKQTLHRDYESWGTH